MSVLRSFDLIIFFQYSVIIISNQLPFFKVKKILVIHNSYKNTGGEDIAVENEVLFLKKYFEVETLFFSNIERKSFNKRRPKKTEQTTNFVKFTNDIKPIPLPQITPEPEPVKVQEPKLKIYKDGGLGTMDRPTQVTIDAYRDLKWFNK